MSKHLYSTLHQLEHRKDKTSALQYWNRNRKEIFCMTDIAAVLFEKIILRATNVVLKILFDIRINLKKKTHTI